MIVTRFTEQSGREWSSDGSSDNAADELDEMGVVITRCRREEELHPRGTHTRKHEREETWKTKQQIKIPNRMTSFKVCSYSC